MQVCNDLLVRHELEALGLCVEGHTSASIHGHEESLMISTKRAKRCEQSIKAHVRAANQKSLRRADGLWGRTVEELINGILQASPTHSGRRAS